MEHTFKPSTTIHHDGLLNPGIMDDTRYRMMLIDGGPFCSKILKRHVIFGDESLNKECKVFPEGVLYEDNAIGSSVKLRMTRFAYLPEPLYFYMQRLGSVTHSLTEKHIQDRWITSHMILDIAQREGNLQKFLPEFEFIFTFMFCVNTFNILMPHIFQGKRNLLKEILDEQKRIFPNFQNNPYYQRRVDPHSRGLMNLLAETL